MQQCTRCGVNEFDPWAAKDKGQKFPFKSCYDCRTKAKAEREQQQTPAPDSDKLNEMHDLLAGLVEDMSVIKPIIIDLEKEDDKDVISF